MSGERRRKQSGRFWTGLFIGFFTAFFLMTLAGFYFVRVAGIQIAIDQENLAVMVKERVKAEVARELPVLMAQVKNEVPKAINANTKDLEEITLQIGNGRFPVPQAATKVIKEEFQGMANEAVQKSINEFCIDPYVQQIGDASYDLVKTTFQEEVAGKRFMVRVYRWLVFPVTVQAK